ncbi:MAG: hypothetical protein ACKOX3_06720 [Bacteroidota bacterium]
MNIINYPLNNYTKEDYYSLYNRVVDTFSNNNSVLNICTFGGVNQPGISDIDLLITFKKDSYFNGNVIGDLSKKEALLFTHGVIALAEQHWYKNKSYALWDNQKIILGDAPVGDEIILDNEQMRILKKQTALEFLLTNYIDLTLQKEYKTIKLRDLLQHTKGISYDLDYLAITNSPIDQYITTAKDWIANWHHSQPSNHEIKIWFNNFYKNYEAFMFDLFNENKLYLPIADSYHFSKNISLINKSELVFSRNGYALPSFLINIFQKKAVKFLNKTNHFEFGAPLTNNAENSILEERIFFFKEMKKYNKIHFPNLGLLTTSLMSKLV